MSSREEAAFAAMMRERITELETQVAGLMTTNAHLEAQLVGLQTMNTEKAAVIRRLQRGNHPAGRALRVTTTGGFDPAVARANIVALREALAERDAEHEGGA